MSSYPNLSCDFTRDLLVLEGFTFDVYNWGNNRNGGGNLLEKHNDCNEARTYARMNYESYAVAL